ncbi:MAG: hypothetical protein ACMUHB_01700 [Thermoplasmatota archaeon]
MGALTQALGIPECRGCGKKGVLAKMYRCEGTDQEGEDEKVCNSRICEECLYQTIVTDDDGNSSITNFCSHHFKSGLGALELGILNDLKEKSEHIYEDGSKLTLKGKGLRTLINNSISKKENSVQKKEEKDERVDLAREHEEAGRFGEAIKLYETLEMWKEAGRVRRRVEIEEKVGKLITMEEKNIFERIREKGVIQEYRCMKCASTIKIDGEKEVLNCPYCDQEIDPERLKALCEGPLSVENVLKEE